jgi:hypothetical protein
MYLYELSATFSISGKAASLLRFFFPMFRLKSYYWLIFVQPEKTVVEEADGPK